MRRREWELIDLRIKGRKTKFCPSTQRTGTLNDHQAGQTYKVEESLLARHLLCSIHGVTTEFRIFIAPDLLIPRS